MRKFIINLTIFGLLFFVYDKLFIVFKEYSADKEIDKRLELVLNGKMNKDIIVLGSSRGANNIIAGKIEKELGKTAFNLSYPASDVTFHDFLLRALVKYNKPPKVLLLAIDDPLELLPTNTQVFRFERLYPIVKYDFINQELVDKGVKNKVVSELFVLHQINKSNLNLKQKKFSPEDTIMSCGSMPISFQRAGRKWIYENSNTTYSIFNEVSEKVNSFKNIINICQQHNIKLIIVTTPNYRNRNLLFEKRIQQLSAKQAIFYKFNTANPIYKNNKYFYDESHLNKKGAEIFSNELVLFLKNENLFYLNG